MGKITSEANPATVPALHRVIEHPGVEPLARRMCAGILGSAAVQWSAVVGVLIVRRCSIFIPLFLLLQVQTRVAGREL